MEALQALINQPIISDHKEWFEKIARLLMGSYQLSVNRSRYRITEIEFYYYSETHPDETVYGYINPKSKYNDRIKRHKNAQQKTMTWFFHYSGVDLVIGRENEPGGILIRAIENIDSGEKITGPLVVILELLNQGLSINGADALRLVLEPGENFTHFDIEYSKRVGLGVSKYEESKYNGKLVKTD